MNNPTFHSLLQSLHRGGNPFEGFTYTFDDLDPQGWNSEHPWFEKLIEEIKPKVILEIGTWKGASARHMANCLKKHNLEGAVICLDTWLAEQILWRTDEWWDSLKMKNGRPHVYQTFMANTVQAGHHDTLIPLSMHSVQGCRYIKTQGVIVDFAYIDGSHEKGDVIRDLEATWDILRPGGAILGDDYIHNHPCVFEGLIEDANEFAAKVGCKLELNQEKFLIRKP